MSSNGVEIINRSDFSTPLLEVIVQWACEQEGITWRYRAVFSRTRHRRKFSYGRGGKSYQVCFVNRRTNPFGGWPMSDTYEAAHPPVPMQYNTRLELLVHLITHEATHATTGSPSRWMHEVYKDGRFVKRVNVAAMEHHCEVNSKRLLEKFHDEWPEIKFRMRIRMREYQRHMKLYDALRFREAARAAHTRNIKSLTPGGLEARMRRLREANS